MASLDELRIEVEASSDGAASSLSELAAAVSQLASKTGKAAAGLTSLRDALRGLTSVGDLTSVAAGIRSVADGAQALSGAKISESIGNQLRNISEAANAADPQALQSMATAMGAVTQIMGGNKSGAFIGRSIAEQMKAIAEASTQLSAAAPAIESSAQSIGTLSGMVTQLASLPSISVNIGNQLSKIAQGAQALSQVTLDEAKVGELANALSRLAEIPKNGLSSTVSAMLKLPQAAAALHGMDFATLAEDCQRLSAALADLPERLANVAAGMRQLVKANAAANRYERMGGARGAAGLLGNLTRLAGVVAIVRRAGQALRECVETAGSYVEDMNLFTVAMGDYGRAAWDYAQRVNAALGINPQEWAQGQGVFMSMAQGMGVASDNAALMSQQLTQLSYDLSSFYNIDVATAMEKVQAGLSGQLRPLRELGYDLSEARLQEDALAWGITKSVDSMTQAEKALLRYREMIEQVSFVHGDMARTVQSPMNQIRIFTATVRQAAVAWGGVLLPALSATMGVLIPIAKALATIGNLIASLTGGKQMMEGFLAGLGSGGGSSSVVSGLEDVEDATSGVGGVAGDAADAYDELKRTILGFDELNVLKAVSDASGGSGGGGGGGAGGGGGGMEGFELPTYDFLGDVESTYAEAYEKIMAFFKRVGEQLEPLYQSFKDCFSRIAQTFEGVDLLGAVEDFVVAGVALFSNMARNVIEAITPIWEAFEVPKVAAMSLEAGAQLFVTISDACNAAAQVVGGFIDTAVAPLASWLSGELTDAIAWAVDELGKFSTWLRDHAGDFRQFGESVGQALDPLVGIVEDVAGPIIDFTQGALTNLFELVRQTAEQLGEKLSPHIQFLGDCFADLREALKPVNEALDGFLGWVNEVTGLNLGSIADVLSGIAESIATVVSGIVAVITDLVTFISDPFGFSFEESKTKQWFDLFVLGTGDLGGGADDAKDKTYGLSDAGKDAYASLDKLQTVIGENTAKLGKLSPALQETASNLSTRFAIDTDGMFDEGIWSGVANFTTALNEALIDPSAELTKALKKRGYEAGFGLSEQAGAGVRDKSPDAVDAASATGSSTAAALASKSTLDASLSNGKTLLSRFWTGICDQDKRDGLANSARFDASLVTGTNGMGASTYLDRAKTRGATLLSRFWTGVCDNDKRSGLANSARYDASIVTGTNGMGKSTYLTSAQSKGKTLLSRFWSGICDSDKRNGLMNSGRYNASLAAGSNGMGHSSYRSTAYDYGKYVTTSFGYGLGDSERRSWVQNAGWGTANTGASAMGDSYYRGWAYDNGYYLTQGFADGIWGNYVCESVKKASKYVAWLAVKTVYNTVQNGSPSRLLMQYGNWFTEGFAIGIGEEARMVGTEAASMAQGAVDAVRGVMGSGALDVGANLSTMGAIEHVVGGTLDLDYDAMTGAVAQGILEGMVAAGGPAQGSAQGGDVVMVLDGREIGRVAYSQMRDMAARGLAPELAGVM